MNKLRKELDILYHFYLEISTRKVAIALGLSYKSVSDNSCSIDTEWQNISANSSESGENIFCI